MSFPENLDEESSEAWNNKPCDILKCKQAFVGKLYWTFFYDKGVVVEVAKVYQNRTYLFKFMKGEVLLLMNILYIELVKVWWATND